MEQSSGEKAASSDQIDPTSPVIFLGLADGEQIENPATPLEALTLFKLGRMKVHFAFPVIAKRAAWCFLVNLDALVSSGDLSIRLVDSQEKQWAMFRLGSAVIERKSSAQPEASGMDQSSAKKRLAFDVGQWILFPTIAEDLLIAEPGEYKLRLEYDKGGFYLGRVIYQFSPPPPLTEEKIAALESDVVSAGQVIYRMGCKQCPSTLTAYIALKKSQEREEMGHVFYRDLPDRFVCGCGRTNLNLDYLRKGGHGFLGRDARISIGEVSYIQRYAHSQLLEIAGQFLGLVQKEKKEEPIQKYLEKNKVLFARFHARRLFVKPRILGRFNADFAILDSQGALVLIEIERPTLRLFKANGHLRGEFNHAYEQVQDWLGEVLKHRTAVIDGLGLKPEEVLTIRGCVIAGRAKIEKREHLRRHMSQPRLNIEFLTLDMLAESLVSMAGELP
jgi:hypothetical protein